MSYQSTSFKTVDGTELRGRLYLASKPGPGVVMVPGFTCVLTMMNLPECAAELQNQGITALLYDPRSVGSSDGQPRHDIDPPQSMSDLSDAFTHLRNQPVVRHELTGFFGFSFGGTVALTTAAVDPRARFTVAVAPLTDLDFTSTSQRWRVLQKAMKDRESQILGNPALVIPLINEKGENAAGFGHGLNNDQFAKLVRDKRELAANHSNKSTLMTYYRIATWTPWPLWTFLSEQNAQVPSRRVLFVIPTDDIVSYADNQRKYFDQVSSGNEDRIKKLEVQGAGHEDVLGETHVKNVVSHIRELVDAWVEETLV